MLVLSRKKSQQIQIGDNITITVLKVKGTSVQIGVEAPSHVKILRSELSFDPPAETAAKTVAPATAAAGKRVTTSIPPATRNGRPIDRRQSFEPEARSPVALHATGTLHSSGAAREDRVTLGDTLVFLG